MLMRKFQVFFPQFNKIHCNVSKLKVGDARLMQLRLERILVDFI